jgi:phage regulator Rha-like protein
MKELILVQDQELTTTSLLIAEGLGLQHHSVIKLVRHNLDDLEDYGRVRFEIRPFNTSGGIQHQEYAILNEHQATYLITLMRNTEKVKKFRKLLVKQFFEMREALSKKPKPIVKTFLDKRIECLAKLPKGYFCALDASLVTMQRIQNSFGDNKKSIVDISIGHHWAKWIKSNLTEALFTRVEWFEYEYPEGCYQKCDYVWVYEDKFLPEFRQWFNDVYLPVHFPAYLNGQRAKGNMSLPQIINVTKALEKYGLNITREILAALPKRDRELSLQFQVEIEIDPC